MDVSSQALHDQVSRRVIKGACMNRGTLLVVSLFIALLVCWLISPAGSEWVALALMIGAGIPHGSFDLRVAEAKWRGGLTSRGAILSGYLVCVFGMSALCVFVPAFGLALFLLISALHFSEGEGSRRDRSRDPRAALFGIGAILLPIGLHIDQAQAYVGYFIPESAFDSLRMPLVIVARVILIVMVALLTKDIVSPRTRKSPDTVERIVCLCAWIFLPPLSGFAVWFIGRHSRQHLEVCREMFAGSRLGIPLDFAAISALAILGLLPFSMLFDFSRIDQLFAASICLIAGLTLPHMIVSHRIREVVR